MESIKISELVCGKRTHPNWSTGSTYPLESFREGNETIVKYVMTKTITKKVYTRRFPNEIKLTSSFCWILGFLKGEGFNGLGKSTYHRFGVTNKDSALINFVLDELNKSGLLSKNSLPDNSIEIMHFSGDKKSVVNYWKRHLDLPASKIKVKSYKHQFKKSEYGVCHVYLTDVLLRRIVDLVHEEIIRKT